MDVDKIIKNANSIKEIVGDGCTAICNAVDALISSVNPLSRKYEQVDHICTVKDFYYYDFVKNSVCKFIYEGPFSQKYAEQRYLPTAVRKCYPDSKTLDEVKRKHLTPIYFCVDSVIAGTPVWNPSTGGVCSTHLLLYNMGHKAALAPDIYDTFHLWYFKMFTRPIHEGQPVQLVRAYIKTIEGDKVELQVQEDGETIKLVPWSDEWTNSPVFKKFENF